MTDIEPLATTDYDAPLWLQALSYPASVDRDLIDAVFVSTGVIRGGLTVAPALPGNMSVDVAPGLVVVAGTDMAGQGKYVGRQLNTVNVALNAAPAAGLTRIDLIHAHITDATVIGGTRNVMTVEEPIAGTAVSSNPVAPNVPNTSEPLAWVTVASGTAAITAAMITDRRRSAANNYRDPVTRQDLEDGGGGGAGPPWPLSPTTPSSPDPAGMVTAGGFKVPAAGLYLFCAMVTPNTITPPGSLFVVLQQNAVALAQNNVYVGAGPAAYASNHVTPARSLRRR